MNALHTIMQNFIFKQQSSTRMKKIFTSLTLCIAFLSTTCLLAQAPIFTDAYATDVTFAAFRDAVNAVSIDNTVNQSGTSSLKIVVPATGYTGGALVAATPQNLSTYNAVSFWIKGSAAKKLNTAGLGNNAATNVYQTELAEIPVTTTWTKFIIPIPVPSKLTAETGLFHFAEGGDEGAYTIWLDNIQYENLAATVVGTPTATIATESITKGIGDAFEATGLSCTFPINSIATKLSLTKVYFTFASSNTAVATVSALGVGSCLSAGTSAITAKLGAVSATGTLTVNVAAVTAPTVAAPTPTRLAANVFSLYSKPYTNLAGTDWFPNWNQSTVVTDVIIAGDSTKRYANFNYQGVQFANPINVTTMGFLHIDLWTPNMTSFKVSLINIPPTVATTVEQAVTLTPTLLGWNSFDIPLSSYTNILKTGIGQFKLESVPFGSGTAFLDNIYFYKTATSTNDVTFAKNLFTTGPSVSDASLTLFLTENVKNTAQVTLTNISGQVVYNQTATANSTHLINTKNLPAGMYIVGVRVGSTIQSEKIVVGR
jgi:Secretion system C-terminal sorting domain